MHTNIETVLKAIQHLNANFDPDFSETTAEDIAIYLNIPVQAVNASLGHLQERGDIELELWDGNNILQTFVHLA